MSGEVEHDELQGGPEQPGEAGPAPSHWIEYLRSPLHIAGIVVVGIGLLVGCSLIFPSFARSHFPGLFYPDESPIDSARADMAVIEKAACDYKRRHGAYPASLNALAVSEDGLPSYLSAKDLLDPWGKPYGYDPRAQSPEGRPKIFAVTPKGDVISNWEQ
jgi:hypothetical protein